MSEGETSSLPPPPKRAVVIGAGCTGLTAAHELAERGFDVTVYDATQDPRYFWPRVQVGGLARTQWNRIHWGTVVEDRKGTSAGQAAPAAVALDEKMRGTEPIVPLPDVLITFPENEHELDTGPAWLAPDPSRYAVAMQGCEYVARLLADVARSCPERRWHVFVSAHATTREAGDPESARILAKRRACTVIDAVKSFFDGRSSGGGWCDCGAEYRATDLGPFPDLVELVPLGAIDVYEDDRVRPPTESRSVRFVVSEFHLPGEHGYRFFPRFYRNLFDTMRRTPLLARERDSDYFTQWRAAFSRQYGGPSPSEERFGSKFRETAETAFDSLISLPFHALALDDGHRPYELPRQRISTFRGIAEAFRVILDELEFDGEDVARFSLKMFRYLSSSKLRREKEAEHTTWLRYIDGARYSEKFREAMEKWPDALVALSATEVDARTHGNITAQLLLDQAKTGYTDGTLNGPTSEAWLEPWRDYLERTHRVRFRLGWLHCFEPDEDGRMRPVLRVPGGGPATAEPDDDDDGDAPPSLATSTGSLPPDAVPLVLIQPTTKPNRGNGLIEPVSIDYESPRDATNLSARLADAAAREYPSDGVIGAVSRFLWRFRPRDPSFPAAVRYEELVVHGFVRSDWMREALRRYASRHPIYDSWLFNPRRWQVARWLVKRTRPWLKLLCCVATVAAPLVTASLAALSVVAIWVGAVRDAVVDALVAAGVLPDPDEPRPPSCEDDEGGVEAGDDVFAGLAWNWWDREPRDWNGLVTVDPEAYVLVCLPARQFGEVARRSPVAFRETGTDRDDLDLAYRFAELAETDLNTPRPPGALRHFSGIQYYLEEDVSWVRGHTYFVDTPYGLSSVSQAQYRRAELNWRSGFRGILSVDIGVFDGRRPSDGLEAWRTGREELARETYRQIARGYSVGASGIDLPEPLYFHVDDALVFYGDRRCSRAGGHWGPLPPGPTEGAGIWRNRTPYLVPTLGTWSLRPGEPADSRVYHDRDGMAAGTLIAGPFMKTYTRLTTMEAANESARHAVNALLQHYRARVGGAGDVRIGSLVETFDPEDDEVPDLEPLKRIDRTLCERGLPHLLDILEIDELPVFSDPRPSVDPFGWVRAMARHLLASMEKAEAIMARHRPPGPP